MRSYIYYSKSAPTSGGYVKEDLNKSGRLDIAVHTIIASFFLSHSIRTDTKLHLVFAGRPDPVKHIIMQPKIEGKTGVDKIYFSKKNVSTIIKKILYKFKEGVKNEVFPGYFIERKSLMQLVKELTSNGKTIYVLDKKGEDIRKVKMQKDPIFLLGDHDGLPSKELKALKKHCTPVSIGKKTYFASQTVSIVNNELDRREEDS